MTGPEGIHGLCVLVDSRFFGFNNITSVARLVQCHERHRMRCCWFQVLCSTAVAMLQVQGAYKTSWLPWRSLLRPSGRSWVPSRSSACHQCHRQATAIRGCLISSPSVCCVACSLCTCVMPHVTGPGMHCHMNFLSVGSQLPPRTLKILIDCKISLSLSCETDA